MALDSGQLIAAVIKLAESKLGQCETGDNSGPVVDWSIHDWSDRPAGHWSAWCAGFVSTCFLESGADFRKIGSLSCDVLWARSKLYLTTFLRGDQDPTTGDILFFRPLDEREFNSTGLLHTGIVASCANGIVHTIEGNSQNMVRRAEYPIDSPHIFSYARYGQTVFDPPAEIDHTSLLQSAKKALVKIATFTQKVNS
jgi:hypothetical protein